MLKEERESRKSWTLPAIVLLLVSTSLGIVTQRVSAQGSLQGVWTTLPNPMPINPVHMALLNNGKVLVVSGSGNVPTQTNYQAGLFDPQSGTIVTQKLAWDMFCNAMVVLP